MLVQDLNPCTGTDICHHEPGFESIALNPLVSVHIPGTPLSIFFLPQIVCAVHCDVVQRDESALRDAYYLWCFNPDITATCIYMPNMWYGDYEAGTETIAYYTDDEFQAWIDRGFPDDVYKKYVADAKNWLIDRAAAEGLTFEDDSGNEIVLNSELLDGTTTITWDDWEAYVWKSEDAVTGAAGGTDGLFYMLSKDSSKSESSSGTILFPSRRCFDADYSELWRDDPSGDRLDNANPPFCNNDDYDYKPRTYGYIENPTPTGLDTYGELSLFPMGTRTRFGLFL